jgi:hypothetical protein
MWCQVDVDVDVDEDARMMAEIRRKYEGLSDSANPKPRNLPVEVTPPASIRIVIKDEMPMLPPADEQV